MLPFHAPLGTTPRDYLARVVPEAHRTLVPGADTKLWDVNISLLGDRSFHYAIRGAELTMREVDEPAHLVLALDGAHVARFLADWSGPRRYVPAFEPRGAALVTDPRVLARLAMVTGSFQASVPDFEDGAIRLALAAFGGKVGRFDPRDDDADASVELPSKTFESLLAGRLGPDEALSAGGVTLKGKRLVAMQFALALAPFFPPR